MNNISRVDLIVPVLRAEAGIVAWTFAIRDLLEERGIETTLNLAVVSPDDSGWENRYQVFIRLENANGERTKPDQGFFKSIITAAVDATLDEAFHDLDPAQLFLSDADSPRRSFDRLWDELKKAGSLALRSYTEDGKWEHPDCREFDEKKVEFIDWFSGWVHNRLVRAGLVKS